MVEATAARPAVNRARDTSHARAAPGLACRHMPAGLQQMVETALQTAYPNCALRLRSPPLGDPPALLRLKKRSEFIRRVKAVDPRNRDPEPSVNRVMTVMGACGEPAFVQLAITPAPATFERLAKHLFKRHEAHLSRHRREHLIVRDRSIVEDAELRGGSRTPVQAPLLHRSSCSCPSRRICEQIASELRAEGAENHLVERGTSVRQVRSGCTPGGSQRGEGNPIPSLPQGSLRLDRARRHLAPALQRVRDRALRAVRAPRRAGAARDIQAAHRRRDAHRCPRPGLHTPELYVSRTPPCPGPSSRASRAISSQPSRRICRGSAAP